MEPRIVRYYLRSGLLLWEALIQGYGVPLPYDVEEAISAGFVGWRVTIRPKQ